jgi:hypothetical protein
MFSQYFGQYLLNKGILSIDQLCTVLDQEKSVKVKVGILAMDAGYMTVQEVEKIHQSQKRQDKRFGELAIEQGFLNKEQLTKLLAIQNQKYLQLSQAIVDQGYLTLTEVNGALKRYKADKHLSDDNVEALVKADVDEIVRFSLDFGGQAKADVYYHYVALVIRNIVRFLGETPVIMKNSPVTNQTYPWLITQKMDGRGGLVSAMGLTDRGLLTIAARYSGDAMTTFIDDYAKDCAAEFLNLTNGIFCVNTSNEGVELELKPQRIQAQAVFPGGKGEIIPIHVSFGDIFLLVL